MATRTITGTLVDGEGNPVVGGEVVVRMMSGTYLLSPVETYVPSIVKATSGTTGTYSVTLEAGLPIEWHVRLPGGDEFVISVPEGSATTMEALRAAYSGVTPAALPYGRRPYQTVYNVLDYDAAADGATNDSTAIEAAILAAYTAGGGIVYLPEGSYRITDDIDLRNDVEIIGDGMGRTTLVVAGNFNAFQGSSNDHNVIRDLTINCASQTGGSGMELNTCTDFRVERVEILNAFGNGISVGGSGTSTPNQLRGSITNCVIKTPGNHGVSLANGTWWVTVSDNQVFDAVESGYNISSSHHCTVSGNIAYNTAFSATAGYAGVRLSNSSEYTTVTGNTVYGFERGVFVASTAGAGNTVTGNTLTNINLQGILVELSDTTVSGNTLVDCYESATGAAIEISTAQRVTVVGNTITDTRTPKQHTYGVRESNGADNNTIAANNVSGVLTSNLGVIGAGTTVIQDVVRLPGQASLDTVFNETGVDTDFRVESDNRPYMFMVDAGTDTVGIGTSSFGTIATFASGVITFNSGASDNDFRVLGDNDTNLLRADASADQVGIGTDTPNTKLTVNGGIAIVDAMAAPSATSGYAKVFVDSSDSDLKVIFGDGTTRTVKRKTAMDVVAVDASVPAGNTIHTTNVATAFSTAVYTIPANSLRVGSVLHFRAAGVYGTAAAAPTLRLRLLGEATALGDSSAQTCTASLTNRGWELNVRSIVTAIGASGTIESQGVSRMNNATNGAHTWDLENTAAATFDTTADIDITLIAVWGTSDAANTITLRQWTVEVLN